jgi:hypothetical protein
MQANPLSGRTIRPNEFAHGDGGFLNVSDCGVDEDDIRTDEFAGYGSG